jgi:hypothetical protein
MQIPKKKKKGHGPGFRSKVNRQMERPGPSSCVLVLIFFSFSFLFFLSRIFLPLRVRQQNILQAVTQDEDDIRDAITFLPPNSRSQMSLQMDGGWAEQQGLE